MVVAEGVPSGNGEIELDIRLHHSDIHHSGPFTGGLLPCLPAPSQNSRFPNLCSPLPATSQGDELATLAILTPRGVTLPTKNSEHFHLDGPRSPFYWALILKSPNKKSLTDSSPYSHPPVPTLHILQKKSFTGVRCAAQSIVKEHQEQPCEEIGTKPLRLAQGIV